MIDAAKLVLTLPLMATTATLRAVGPHPPRLPRGFLGTRADILFDTIAVSLVLIAAILAWSQLLARARQYRRHRVVMTTLFVALTVVLLLFEADLRMAGGPKVLFKDSHFAGTAFLKYSLYFHVSVAMMTFAAWIGLIAISLRGFMSSLPGRFSSLHRIWGRSVFYGYLIVAATAVEVYVVGFVL
jgi:putative membrane protein